VPWDLEKFWIGHANKDITDKYAEQLKEDVEYRRDWVERVGLGFVVPVCPNPISSWMKSTRRNLLQLEEIASQFPGSSTVEHSAVNRELKIQ